MVPELKKRIRGVTESKLIESFTIEQSLETNLDTLLSKSPSKITLYFTDRNQHIDLSIIKKWNQKRVRFGIVLEIIYSNVSILNSFTNLSF